MFRKLVLLSIILIVYKTKAQNTDSTFKSLLYNIPAAYTLDDRIYSIEQSENLSVSFVNSQSFYYTVLDLNPYFLNLVNKKTKQKIPILHGKASFEKDIRNDFFQTSINKSINKPFASFKLYSPETLHFNPLAPKFTNSDKVFNNKVTIIHAWEYGCGPCMEEMPLINNLADSLKETGIQIIGLHRGYVGYDKGSYSFSSNTGKPVVVSVHFSQYPITDEIMKKIGIMIFPTTYILDKHGIIRAVFMGSINAKMILPILQSLRFYSMYQ
ncbi:TlpA family protein disulfide reductase [Chitinophagaceae bacterium MMS25-I14]